MLWRLRDCGVPARHLMYAKLSHADFVTAWHPLPGGREDNTGTKAAEAAGVGAAKCSRESSEAEYAVLSSSRGRGQDLIEFSEDLVAVLHGAADGK